MFRQYRFSQSNNNSIISIYDLVENKTHKRMNIIKSQTIYLLGSVVYFGEKNVPEMS